MSKTNDPSSAAPGTPVSGWVFDCGYRGTLEIIYGCAMVLIAAVWTVIHLNVPAKGESDWRIILRRVRWGLVAVFAPDFLTLVAASQRHSAKESMQQMRQLSEVSEWSLEHAFYANSGGFMLQTPDTEAFPINSASLHYLVARGYIPFPTITREEVWDKSKADVFAKGLAILQGGWMIVHVIARLVQGLPLAPLELFTLAFVIPTAMSYYFWWRKPQHVKIPTVLDCSVLISTILVDAGFAPDAAYDDTPMDFIERPLQFWKRRSIFDAFDLERGERGSRKPDDAESLRPSSGAGKGLEHSQLNLDHKREDVNIKDSTSPSSRTSTLVSDAELDRAIDVELEGPTKRLPDPEKGLFGSEKNHDFRRQNLLRGVPHTAKATSPRGLRRRIPDDSILPIRMPLRLVVLLLIPSILHSTIHLVGWNHEFPTRAEQIIWRGSVIVLIVMSCLSVGIVRILGLVKYQGRYNLVWVWVNAGAKESPSSGLPRVWDALLTVSALLLFLARCFLITIGLISLRQLPAATFVDISWTDYIPHI